MQKENIIQARLSRMCRIVIEVIASTDSKDVIPVNENCGNFALENERNCDNKVK